MRAVLLFKATIASTRTSMIPHSPYEAEEGVSGKAGAQDHVEPPYLARPSSRPSGLVKHTRQKGTRRNCGTVRESIDIGTPGHMDDGLTEKGIGAAEGEH